MNTENRSSLARSRDARWDLLLDGLSCWLLSIAFSVMDSWTAVLALPAADAGSTSIDTAMLTASRNARIRFFMEDPP